MTNKLKSLIHEMRLNIATEDEMVDFLLQHDVVPVIRCENCKYYGNATECPLMSMADFTEDDEFCSMGERKADNDS